MQYLVAQFRTPYRLSYTVYGAAQARPEHLGLLPTNTITSGPGRHSFSITTIPPPYLLPLRRTACASFLLTHNRSFHHHHHHHRLVFSSSSTTPHLLHEGLAVRLNHRLFRLESLESRPLQLPPPCGLGLRRVGRHDDTSASPRCFPLQPERPVVASYQALGGAQTTLLSEAHIAFAAHSAH